MPIKHPILFAALLTAPVFNAPACIQRAMMPPPPQQLPTGLFKMHVHIAADPMMVELALPGGVTQVSLGRANTDPQEDFARIIRDYEADPGAHGSFNDRLDYSAALIFTGRIADAVVALTKLETDFPGKYATASNLGTAYELADDLPNAVKWISEGVKRNPDSHEGTEWLHLAILRAKQQLKSDQGWLYRHAVLEAERHRANTELEKALEYQLNERLYFIKANDPVMCDLFYEAARLTLNPDKRAYFIRQAVAFGEIRDGQIYSLTGARPR